MRKALALLFTLFFMGFGPLLFAQEDSEGNGGDEEIPADEWDGVIPSTYSNGDQNFTISVGTTIPLFFTDNNGATGANVQVGGMLSLAYNYFFTHNFFAGGEAGGSFAATLGENMLYIIPFGLKVGYQFVLRRFEFPVSLMIGGATQKYLETDYFGLFLKPAASVFFRFNPDWSFGLNVGWWIVPEWTKESRKDMAAHFLEITLSARYHF